MRRISVKLILLLATVAATPCWGQPPTISSLQASPVGSPAADVTGITSGTTLQAGGFFLYVNSATADFNPANFQYVTWLNTSTNITTQLHPLNGSFPTANLITVLVPNALFATPVANPVAVTITVHETTRTSNSVTFTINPPLAAVTVLPAGTLNVPYSSSLTTGGSYPFQDAILSLGAYPPGINSPVSGTSTLGRIALANESARELFGFEGQSPQGTDVAPYLPVLYRIMKNPRSAANLRTNVECKAHRLNGEVFLAHVWLSTYYTSQGAGMAAVVWDGSENLRDREGSGFDSMMATSRVLIGAISHEIRNLASAAASAHARLAAECPVRGNGQYEVLGTLIQGLEKIASSGLRAASEREAVVADLGTVLDEARIVIEPGLRDAGISLIWEVGGALPLVQADRHSLLPVFVNPARNSAQALQGRPVREVRIDRKSTR